MNIGKLSKKSGISQRMIRYYEEQGLLKPMRSETNYRQYSEADVCRLGRIQTLQEAGLTLKIIHQLLPCIVNEAPIRFEPCQLVFDTLILEKNKLQQKVSVLQESLLLLDQYINEVGNEEDPNKGLLRNT